MNTTELILKKYQIYFNEKINGFSDYLIYIEQEMEELKDKALKYIERLPKQSQEEEYVINLYKQHTETNIDIFYNSQIIVILSAFESTLKEMVRECCSINNKRFTEERHSIVRAYSKKLGTWYSTCNLTIEMILKFIVLRNSIVHNQSIYGKEQKTALEFINKQTHSFWGPEGTMDDWFQINRISSTIGQSLTQETFHFPNKYVIIRLISTINRFWEDLKVI